MVVIRRFGVSAFGVKGFGDDPSPREKQGTLLEQCASLVEARGRIRSRLSSLRPKRGLRWLDKPGQPT